MLRKKIKLWKKFWLPLLTCLLFATYIPIFTNFFFGTIYALFFQQEPTKDYTKLIPPQFWKPFNEHWFLSKRGFILLGTFSVCLYFLFSYFHEFYAQKLIIKISTYLKNRTLKKFRRLSLEEQLKQKAKISSLVERDNGVVGYHWVNFWKNLYQGSVSFGLLFYSYFYRKRSISQAPQQGINEQISNRVLFFTIFWLVLMVGVIWLFYKISYRSGKKTKQKISLEHKEINQEINNSVLINSMGLRTGWEKKQQGLTQQSQQTRISTAKRIGLEKDINWKLLINLLPFGLLILEPNFIGASFGTIWDSLNNCVWAFGYLVNWSDYASSRIRVDTFLNLPEKNDNLKGIKISTEIPIKKISFENVSFKYQEQKDLMTFNQNFMVGEINYLTAPIGSGKTTKLYLLLGLLSPRSGKIIIYLQNGVNYNLQQLNLQHWREKQVAFISHENLIETGSTGQKQWQNLETILAQKASAQVFLFDEADNALDPAKQASLQQKLTNLAKDRVVVFAKC